MTPATPLYLRFKNKSTVVLHLQRWLEIHFLSVRRILLTNRSVIQEIPSQLPADTTGIAIYN